jgi:hypothetical protein
MVTPIQASITVFTNRSAFLAATQSTTNIDFEGIVPVGGVEIPDYGYTISGATFTGPESSIRVEDLPSTLWDWGSGAILQGNKNTTIDVILPSGVTAVGSDFMSIRDDAAPFTVTLSDGSSYMVASDNYPTRAFVGFTSNSSSISSISFSASNNATPLLDNFVFGTAAVPEPSSFVLLSIGAISLLGYVRRRRAA